MARIFFKGEWFEEISPASIYEDDFERLVTQHAGSLYPQFVAVPFKTQVESESGPAKPDMALVSLAYDEWWVVEVELAHHSLNGHVLPQVRRLATATYGMLEAKFLCGRTTALDINRVEQMMKGRQPRVLVIVNAPCPEWVTPLSRWDSCVAIVQIYMSERNQVVLRVNGEHPAAKVEQTAECFFEPPLSLLIVDTPVLVPKTKDERVRIFYENKLTEWRRIETQDRVLLAPMAANPLNIKRKYKLVREGDGALRIFEKTG